MHHVLISVTAVLECLLLYWFLQAPLLMREVRMDLEMSHSSACQCRNVWANMAAIPEHQDTWHNMILLPDNGCRVQESFVKNENLKIDIEVCIRILCVHCFELYLQ